MRDRRALLALPLLCGLAALGAPASASAHAIVEGSAPLSGETIKRQPQQVEFRFSEAVEGNFGAIRVYDRRSQRVETGEAFHPGGTGSQLATRLKPSLPKGTYTATYRVISADSHPVSGGLVFSIGRASAGGVTVSDLLKDRGGTGDVTEFFFGATRAVQYGATAIGIGGIFFLIAIWLPALASVAGAGEEWRRASERFAGRLIRLLTLAVLVGIVSGILGIVFQGATAAGTSFWDALKKDVVEEVIGTRFGTVWAIRTGFWVVLAGVLAATLAGARSPVLRPASVGATGLALSSSRKTALGLLALPLGFLAIAPALAGHASLQNPTAVLLPANIIHVLAMSVWSAGLVVLVTVLPAATREIDRGERTRLLAANLARYSAIAGVAVAALLVTGALQAFFEVNSISKLWSTSFGRAVLIKTGLLLVPLVALGAYNRQIALPRLKRIATGAEAPGRAGLLLRRSLLLEVALIAAVLGVTSALVSYPPPESLATTGPVSKTASMGPADLQVTIDPARAGANVLHVYLTDKRAGTQFDKAKEFKLSAALPGKDIGNLTLDARKAGPGHWVANGAVFGVAGDWELRAEARVSDFDSYYAKISVPIR